MKKINITKNDVGLLKDMKKFVKKTDKQIEKLTDLIKEVQHRQEMSKTVIWKYLKNKYNLKSEKNTYFYDKREKKIIEIER